MSESSCYRILKSLGLLQARDFREAPRKVPRYEPFRPNQIWAEDWRGLSIQEMRCYLLTLIDVFARHIMAWGIVKTVTRSEVKDLVALAVMSQGIDTQHQRPILRTDPGSPNMAGDFRVFLREVSMGSLSGRVHHPTDNAHQERFYRTVKQKEIYCYFNYTSEEAARSSLARFIDYYNVKRPHQALWGFTPGHAYWEGNKSHVLEEYRS